MGERLEIHEHVTDAIKTPALIRLTPNTVLVRFETLKVYAALGAVRHLLDTRKVHKGQTLVDSSSGIYALALAMACHRYGLRCHIVASTTVDTTIRAQLEILGATVDQMPPSDNLRLDQQRRVTRVRELLAHHPTMHWMRQYHDPIHHLGYTELADLLRRTLPTGPLTVVGSVGTGASTGGLARALREHDPDVRLVGVQPFGSVTFGSEHLPDPDAIIAGIGSAIPFDNVHHELYDQIHWVNFTHAMAATISPDARPRRLRRPVHRRRAPRRPLGNPARTTPHPRRARRRHRTPLHHTSVRPPPRGPRPHRPHPGGDRLPGRPRTPVVHHGLEPPPVHRTPTGSRTGGQEGPRLVTTIALLEALTFGLGRLLDAATEAGHRLCLLTGESRSNVRPYFAATF